MARYGRQGSFAEIDAMTWRDFVAAEAAVMRLITAENAPRPKK